MTNEHSTKPVAGPGGFSTLLENFIERPLDLNELCITHPAATFFVRAVGTSLESAGIRSQAILIVDRSLFLAHNKIAIVRLHGEFTIKRIVINNAKLFLIDDTLAAPIEIKPETDFECWGIVTYSINQL